MPTVLHVDSSPWLERSIKRAYYGAGTEASKIDYVTPYLRAIFVYLGLTHIAVHAIGGTAAAIRAQFGVTDSRGDAR